MIERHIKGVIDYSIKHFPCVIVTGPRQVGKSTLLTKKYENNGFSYVFGLEGFNPSPILSPNKSSKLSSSNVSGSGFCVTWVV